MKTIKLIFTASIILLFFVSCEKSQEGKWATYYKTVGEGYIWDETNNKPLEGATVTVESIFPSPIPITITPSVYETFTTDENGYYQIRFIKRTKNKKVERYWISTNPSGTFSHIDIYPEDIKDKKIITFDTIKVYME